MTRALQRLFIASSLLFIGVTFAFAQPTITITNVKDACAGLDNGSFDVNILTANGSVTLLIFGPPNFNRVTSAGQTESFTGLRPQNYLIIAQDVDGNNVKFQPILNVPVNISFSSPPAPVNNSNCNSPNGSITIFPTGGNGGPYNYFWTGPGAFSASTQNLSSLSGGNYVVTVTDPTANCSFTSGPIAITDPSPMVQAVSTPSPEIICQGDPAVITLASSQPLSLPLSYYEILNNGSPTGVRVSGTGGPIALILPGGSFANGDVLTVLAVDDLCTPTLMSGSVTLSLHTPPSSATLSGTTSICTGQSTNLSVAIVGGTAPFSFNITNFGPVAGYNSGDPLAVTPGATITYTLGGLVTDANGCTVAGAGTATVTVSPPPAATINASTAAICAGQGSSTLTFTLTGTGPTFNVAYSDGSTTFNLPGIATGHTVVVSPAATTTYTITSIIDATTLCVGIPGSNTTVTVSSPPSSATLNLPGPDPICAGQSTFLSVTIVGGTSPYDFTIPGIPPQVGYTSGTIITVTPPVTTPYVLGGVTVTDAKGCTVIGTGGVIIAVNPLPTATVSALPATICAGQGSSTLTFTMTGSSPFNIIYSDGSSSFNLNGVASGHTVVVSPASTTTYEITSIQDVTGCFGVPTVPTSSAIVTVNTPPTSATLSLAGGNPICGGQSTTLQVVIVGGAGPFDFTITGLGPQTAYVSGTPITVTPAATTTFTLSGLVTDAGGCTVSGTGSVPITVNPAPTATISGGGTVCSGAPFPDVTFTFTGTAPFDFSYSDGTTPTSVFTHLTNTFIITNAPVGTYSVTALSDNDGCSGTSFGTPVSVIVNPLPTAMISGTASLCAGGNTPLGFALPAGIYDVVYTDGVSNFTLNGISNGASVNVSPSLSTSYTIVSVTNTATTCSSTAPSPNITGSADITVNALPTALISGGGQACSGSPAPDVTFNFTGTAPFTFTYSDGTTPVTIVSHPTAVFTISNPPVGTYSITGLADDIGCFGTNLGSPVTVSANPLPTASIAGTTSICSGGSTALTFTLPVGTYDVVYTDGTSNFVLNSISDGATATVVPALTTSYTIVSVTNTVTTCSVTAPDPNITGSADVTVIPSPTAAISGGGIVCFSSPLPDVTFTFTGTAPFDFSYSDGTTTISVFTHLTNTFTITNAPAGTYSVTALSDNTGCGGSSLGTPVTVIVNPLPTASISGGGTVCTGSPVPDVMFTFTGTAPFDFSYSDGTTTISVFTHLTNTFTISNAPAGTYSITALSDNSGCGGSSLGTPVAVTVNPLPTASVSGGGTVCSSSPLPNVDFTFTGSPPFDFSYSDGTTTTSVVGNLTNTFTIAAAAVGTYSVTALNDIACVGTSLGSPVSVIVTPVPTGVLSGSTAICVGSSASLTITLTGSQPWDITISDGSGTLPVNGIAASPFTLVVNPLISTTYTLVSVTDAACGAGTASGTATVTVNTIAGNPAIFGIDTWLGYVFDDAGDPTPLPARINFSNPKYRGSIDENDIAGMSPLSSYNTVTDEFDLNISDNPTGFTVHSSNLCGSFNDDFSIRYRMKKTFAQGVFTFTVSSDDGVRLFLDGVSIIPGAFINQLYTTYTSAPQCISAGQHDLVIEYYENTAFSRLTFNYQAAPAPSVTTPVTTCVNSAAPTLTASSVDPGVIGFNWYKEAALTTLLFSGANFTPLAADLDMTVAATTSFFATAVYACGETLAAQVDVNVVTTAVITPPSPPTQVCQSGGIVDLTTLVSAVPSGGTFTFSGTGVTTSPSFDPTLVAGSTTITADYASGTCTASINFNIDVVTVAVITVPASPVATCQTSGLIDMTTLVSATPAGGTFTFTGAGVTGINFDPSAQSGAVPITVDYNAGGCTDSQTLNFNVTATATLTISNPTVCPAAGTVDLTTLVNAVPGGGTFTFSGPSVTGSSFDPSGHAGAIVTINVDYDQGGCVDSGTINITVRNAADPLCGSVSNCSVFTVTITDTRPSCINQNDGVININVTGGTPNYVVTLNDGGSFNQALLGPGPIFTFTNLSAANYQYTIQDGGGNLCTLPHSLPISGTIQASASGFVDALCFNQAVGGATITVNSGGASPYEYSIDGGTSWIVFTSPVTINNLMPSAASYAILVRDDASDLCPGQVMVTIHNAGTDIAAPYAVLTNATCANNDGSVQIGTVTGGFPPYTFVLDGVNFANLPVNNTFTALSGGAHLFTVVDANSCRKDFPINITFPGLVDFTTAVIDPDCTGNGTNGQLIVTITSVGSFQVGISMNPLTPPASFQNVVSGGSSSVTFNNLSKGTYYVTAKAVAALCPTVSPATLAAGPVAIDFLLTADDILCFENKGGVTLKNILGSPAVNYTYRILNFGIVVQSGVITTLQAVADVPLTGLDKGDYSIQLTQDQSAATGCPGPIASAFNLFTVQGPTGSLDTLSVDRTISLPDQATGSMLLSIQESGQEPYEVRLELIQPIFPTQFYLLDWTPATRNPQNLKIEFSATNLFAGEYKLSLRDALGCEKEYAITLEVDTDVFIPNVFTPNNDGFNDVFYIRNKPAGTNVIITNRWGKEVYRSGDYKNDWGGGNSEDGIYYYSINAGGQTFNGWLEIQRSLGQ